MADKIKKLSEAIRLGAKLRPQCTSGHYFEDGKSCAFGAAYEAVTGQVDEWQNFIAHQMETRFGIEPFIGKCIITMNDQGQTREQIADWLEAQGL